MLKVKTTYIDRTKPNEWAYQHAQAHPTTLDVQKKQVQYYAHITRHQEDIIYQVCLHQEDNSEHSIQTEQEQTEQAHYPIDDQDNLRNTGYPTQRTQ